MIKLDKDFNGFININSFDVNVNMFKPDRCGLSFVKDNNTYFYKRCNKNEMFKEIFAASVADKMGVEHADYNIATYFDSQGVICNAVNNEDEEFISLVELKNRLRLRNKVDNSIDCMKKKILPKICEDDLDRELDKFISVFIFDILMANSDRNQKNTGFIKKGNNYRFSPIFDNEEIANPLAIDEHKYSFEVVNHKFDGLNYDPIIDFFKNKNYGYLLSDAIDRFDMNDLYDLVELLNGMYPNRFDKDYEVYILDELKRNLETIKDYRYDYYDESKMLRRK